MGSLRRVTKPCAAVGLKSREPLTRGFVFHQRPSLASMSHWMVLMVAFVLGWNDSSWTRLTSPLLPPAQPALMTA